MVAPKIDNVKLLAEASDGARELATLTKAEELVVVGAPKDGFLPVQAASGNGWIKLVLVERR